MSLVNRANQGHTIYIVWALCEKKRGQKDARENLLYILFFDKA